MTFKEERTALMENEASAKEDFDAKEKALTDLIGSEDASLAAGKTEKATKEQTLAEQTATLETKRKTLEDLKNMKAAQEKTCTDAKATFEESQEMRAKEIEALGKAIAVITGEGEGGVDITGKSRYGKSSSASLLLLRSSRRVLLAKKKARGGEDPSGAEGRVVLRRRARKARLSERLAGLLKSEAKTMASPSLAGLADRLGVWAEKEAVSAAAGR